jgi:hypothetical protein
MRTKFVISTRSGKILEISGLELVQIINIAYEQIYNLISHYSSKQALPEVVVISNQQLWLALPRLFFDRVKNNKVKSTTIRITSTGTPIQIIDGINRIVCFPNKKGTYTDITKEILRIQQEDKLSDTEINNLLKDRIQLKPYPDKYKKHAYFFDALLVLLLVVEPSRHYPAAFYICMLFDLMDYTLKVPGWSWKNAFQSVKKYRYDDFENLDTGGKYPLATHSTGSGNITDFANLLKNTESEEKRMASVLSQPQHHAILTKGMTLIVHWLTLLQDSDAWDFLILAKDENELKVKLGKIFCRHIIDFYIPASLIQKEEKNTIKATQFNLLFQGIGGAPPKLRLNKFKQIAILLAQFSGLSLTANEIDEEKIDDKANCIIYSHTRDDKSYKAKIFHRNYGPFGYCKLIPEYVLNDRHKTIKNNNGEFKVSAKREVKTVKQARDAKLQACEYCYRKNYYPKSKPTYGNHKKPDDKDQKTISAGRYEDYLLQSMKAAVIRFHVKPDNDLHYYFYCCNTYLTESKQFTPNHKPIVTKILENIEWHFYGIDYSDDRYVTAKVTRYPLVESLIRQIMFVVDKIFSLEEKIIWLKRLLKASIVSVGGTPVVSQYNRLLGVFGLVVNIFNRMAYLSEEYEAHLRLLLATYLINTGLENFLEFIEGLNQDYTYPRYGVPTEGKGNKLSIVERYGKRIHYLCKALGEQSTSIDVPFSDFYPEEQAVWLQQKYTYPVEPIVQVRRADRLREPIKKCKRKQDGSAVLSMEMPLMFPMLSTARNKSAIDLNLLPNKPIKGDRIKEFSHSVLFDENTLVVHQMELCAILDEGDCSFRMVNTIKSFILFEKTPLDSLHVQSLPIACQFLLSKLMPLAISNNNKVVLLILEYLFVSAISSPMLIDDSYSTSKAADSKSGPASNSSLSTLGKLMNTSRSSSSRTTDSKFDSKSVPPSANGSADSKAETDALGMGASTTAKTRIASTSSSDQKIPELKTEFLQQQAAMLNRWNQLKKQEAEIKQQGEAVAQRLYKAAASKNYDCIPVSDDGNCQFRAVEAQLKLHKDELEKKGYRGLSTLTYSELRKRAVQVIRHNRQQFEFLVDGEIEDYLAKMSKDKEWGDQFTLLALSQSLNVNIKLLHADGNEILFPDPSKATALATITLGYNGANHYWSLQTKRPAAVASGTIGVASSSAAAAATASSKANPSLAAPAKVKKESGQGGASATAFFTPSTPAQTPASGVAAATPSPSVALTQEQKERRATATIPTLVFSPNVASGDAINRNTMSTNSEPQSMYKKGRGPRAYHLGVSSNTSSASAAAYVTASTSTNSVPPAPKFK